MPVHDIPVYHILHMVCQSINGSHASFQCISAVHPSPNPPTHLCTKMVFMPSALASAHACCPPAPPKHASTCVDASKPFICVRARMGRHMASLATRMNPMVMSSKDLGALPCKMRCTRRKKAGQGGRHAGPRQVCRSRYAGC